ncbi:acryloyl-CoA reductase [Paenarthrobacter sp. NPDC058040]|uniref:acrylyl-CoA reductase family protein n=1 Tax=unclassified Paenarthrobacter TaxID=2634190 RepID=UPI0036DDCC49
MRRRDGFRGFVVTHGQSSTDWAIHDDLDEDMLGEGDITIRVAWSSLNYKDALASTHGAKVARLPRLVPGIDLAGTVVHSTHPEGRHLVGLGVLVHGYDLGTGHNGGFGEYARVPLDWVVPLPEGLRHRDAMVIGTAGFTAALSVQALESRGLRPGDGPVLVTGASGGVGSVAVDLLAARGYDVVVSTGKAEAGEWLRSLGAVEVIPRSEIAESTKPLAGERWAGAVDCVGGDTLAYVLSSLRYGATVAASGNTSGAELRTTVFPFILRGTSLVGIDSVRYPIKDRRQLWNRLGQDLRPAHLDELATAEVELDELPHALKAILAGQVSGRTVVRLEQAG